MGNKLSPLEDEFKVENNIVKGCQSKVWLTSSYHDGRINFRADSNTDITRGMISMLIRIWDQRTTDEILDSDLYFVERIGMRKVVGSQRSSGLDSMSKKQKLTA